MKDKEMLKIDKTKLDYVRKYLVNEVFRNLIVCWMIILEVMKVLILI